MFRPGHAAVFADIKRAGPKVQLKSSTRSLGHRSFLFKKLFFVLFISLSLYVPEQFPEQLTTKGKNEWRSLSSHSPNFGHVAITAVERQYHAHYRGVQISHKPRRLWHHGRAETTKTVRHADSKPRSKSRAKQEQQIFQSVSSRPVSLT